MRDCKVLNIAVLQMLGSIEYRPIGQDTFCPQYSTAGSYDLSLTENCTGHWTLLENRRDYFIVITSVPKIAARDY